jgi:hypothetical protein
VRKVLGAMETRTFYLPSFRMRAWPGAFSSRPRGPLIASGSPLASSILKGFCADRPPSARIQYSPQHLSAAHVYGLSDKLVCIKSVRLLSYSPIFAVGKKLTGWSARDGGACLKRGFNWNPGFSNDLEFSRTSFASPRTIRRLQRICGDSLSSRTWTTRCLLS